MALLPNLCQPGDDNKYGSSAVVDIYCLQAISKRVHIREQVAEAKYKKYSKTYDQLIMAEDIEGIIAQLRNVAVEQENLRRIRDKSKRYNLPANVIVEFLEEHQKRLPEARKRINEYILKTPIRSIFK